MNRLNMSEWNELVTLYEGYTGTIKEFCTQYNVALSTFNKKRKIIADTTSSGISPVPYATTFEKVSVTPTTIKVRIDGIDLEVDKNDFKEMLRILR